MWLLRTGLYFAMPKYYNVLRSTIRQAATVWSTPQASIVSELRAADVLWDETAERSWVADAVKYVGAALPPLKMRDRRC